MTTTQSPEKISTVVELKPSYRLPLAIILSAPLLWFLQPWVAGLIFSFGIFLLVQAVFLRLKFTSTDMDLYRGEKLIRRFPYAEWINWRIFWTPVPILFYFKEVKSIHFMPILFDPKMLQTCLEQSCPKI